MPDYWRDWREINAHGEGSELKRRMLDKGIRKLEEKMAKRGVDVKAIKQADLVRGMYETDRRPGEPDKEYWDRLKKVEEEFNRMMYRFCSARLLRHDYSDWTGWQYRSWFEIQTHNHPQRWKGEKIKSLAVLAEQGVGDEIMFSSCVPDIQDLGIEVTIECDPRLEAVFQRSFGCKTRPRDDVVNRATAKYVSSKRPEDALIPIGDLVKLFRRKKEDFRGPYLKPDQEKVEKWSHLKGKTGIAWRGRRGKFEPKQLGIEGAVCLQYDSWDVETEGMVIPDCDLKADLEDVMGICANLEKIVSVPQTIVHLAGAQGVKVEVIVPPVTSAARAETQDQLNWRYGSRGRMDWYPSVTVFPNLYLYGCRH